MAAVKLGFSAAAFRQDAYEVRKKKYQNDEANAKRMKNLTKEEYDKEVSKWKNILLTTYEEAKDQGFTTVGVNFKSVYGEEPLETFLMKMKPEFKATGILLSWMKDDAGMNATMLWRNPVEEMSPKEKHAAICAKWTDVLIAHYNEASQEDQCAAYVDCFAVYGEEPQATHLMALRPTIEELNITLRWKTDEEGHMQVSMMWFTDNVRAWMEYIDDACKEGVSNGYKYVDINFRERDCNEPSADVLKNIKPLYIKEGFKFAWSYEQDTDNMVLRVSWG